MPPQFLWCARCHTAFTFNGPHFERAAGGKPAIRHDCGALNEVKPHGMSEAGYELWKVIGEVRPMH
jgi:hypothetical protein